MAGVAYPESGNFISGMGAVFVDIDNDGWHDIWHTAIEGESFPLFRNHKAWAISSKSPTPAAWAT